MPQWALDQAAPIHQLTFPASAAEAITQVDGLKSLLTPGPPRLAEGIVWHTADGAVVPELGRSTLKAISNRYIAKAA